MQMTFEGASERQLPGGGHFVQTEKASWIYWYKNGHQVCGL